MAKMIAFSALMAVASAEQAMILASPTTGLPAVQIQARSTDMAQAMTSASPLTTHHAVLQERGDVLHDILSRLGLSVEGVSISISTETQGAPSPTAYHGAVPAFAKFQPLEIWGVVENNDIPLSYKQDIMNEVKRLELEIPTRQAKLFDIAKQNFPDGIPLYKAGFPNDLSYNSFMVALYAYHDTWESYLRQWKIMASHAAVDQKKKDDGFNNGNRQFEEAMKGWAFEFRSGTLDEVPRIEQRIKDMKKWLDEMQMADGNYAEVNKVIEDMKRMQAWIDKIKASPAYAHRSEFDEVLATRSIPFPVIARSDFQSTSTMIAKGDRHEDTNVLETAARIVEALATAVPAPTHSPDFNPPHPDCRHMGCPTILDKHSLSPRSAPHTVLSSFPVYNPVSAFGSHPIFYPGPVLPSTLSTVRKRSVSTNITTPLTPAPTKTTTSTPTSALGQRNPQDHITLTHIPISPRSLTIPPSSNSTSTLPKRQHIPAINIDKAHQYFCDLLWAQNSREFCWLARRAEPMQYMDVARLERCHDYCTLYFSDMEYMYVYDPLDVTKTAGYEVAREAEKDKVKDWPAPWPVKSYLCSKLAGLGLRGVGLCVGRTQV